MSLTAAIFKQEYPEFKRTSDDLIKRKLAAATLRVASAVWGAKTDSGVLLLTAHLLSLSPQGENARLEPGQTTMYKEEFDRIRREVTIGVGRAI